MLEDNDRELDDVPGLGGDSDKKSLGDLHLNEKWGADDNDLRLFKALGKFFSGEAGYRAQAFPGFVRSCDPYRAIVSRGTVADGNKAKTLLAIIMELDNIEQLGAMQYIGSMSDNVDPGLEIIKVIIVPYLVEDLAVYAGWAGYFLPAEAIHEFDPEKKKRAIMDYTKGWIMEQLSLDPATTHYVQQLEDSTLENLMHNMMYLDKDTQ